MGSFDIGLGRKIFQVDPNWDLAGAGLIRVNRSTFNALREMGDKRLWNFTSKGFKPYICALQVGQNLGLATALACNYRNARPLTLQGTGRHPYQGSGVVNPKPHAVAACGQISTQAPAHANVTKVVDYAAKNIQEHGRHCPWTIATHDF
jgi:hypothetical protein